MSTQADAMPDSYPVQWTGRLAILALPQHVRDCNAGQIREQLLWVINRGAAPARRSAYGAASEASRIRGQFRGGDRAGGGQVSTAALPGPLRYVTAQLDEIRSGDVPADRR